MKESPCTYFWRVDVVTKNGIVVPKNDDVVMKYGIVALK